VSASVSWATDYASPLKPLLSLEQIDLKVLKALVVRLTSAGNSELGALMLKLQRVAWEKRTPLALSTLRRALSGKQRPESGDVVHALQVLQERGYGVLEPMEYRGQQGWKYTASKPLLTAN
jgi:hypothetical protein